MKNQKGISIYLALMMITVLLAVALGMSTILVGQIKMIRGIGDSVIALYAADTGTEKILYDASQGIDIIAACPESTPCQGSLNGISFRAVVFPPGLDCSGEYYCIRSVGIYRGTKRAIQVKR